MLLTTLIILLQFENIIHGNLKLICMLWILLYAMTFLITFQILLFIYTNTMTPCLPF